MVQHSILTNLLLIALAAIGPLLPTVSAKPSILQRPSSLISKSSSSSKTKKNKEDDAYQLLARSVQTRLNKPADNSSSSSPTTNYDIAAISSALRSLSTTQAALKKIDGTAHEMYQRTHKSSTSLDDDDAAAEQEVGEGDNDDASSGGKVAGLKVAGRMSRNAARVGCIADALFGAELCELIKLVVSPPSSSDASSSTEDYTSFTNDEDGTLASWTGRKVVLNTIIHSDSSDDLAISVLVIYESDYNGGAGVGHGGVDDLLSFAKEEMEEEGDEESNSTDVQPDSPRGRYLVILSDNCDLQSIISVLDTPSEQIRTQHGPPRGSNGADAAISSVCGPLYHMAGKLLNALEPILVEKEEKGVSEDEDGSDDEDGEQSGPATKVDDSSNPQSLPAIHFAGYSLAGGVAAAAANILDGSLPMMEQSKGSGQQPLTKSMSGFARDRTSALCLGTPPCLSSNLQSPFITSVIHGDDIVCRTSHGTIDHLCDRVRRSIKGGLLGRSVGWMSEAVSLTVSGLKSNDKGKGSKLVVPGKVFLVRPRRIGGGSSSIHEVGGHGREAFRAALLWQLNDVLLSKSLWAHHRLDSYIRSLDRVRLKGFVDDPSDEM